MEMLKKFDVYDRYGKVEYKVNLHTPPHAYERFIERGDIAKDGELQKNIEKAFDKIINDYPDFDGQYVIKMPKIGVKIPLQVNKPRDNKVDANIFTFLAYNMKSQTGVPFITVEDMYYELGAKEIII